MILPQRRITAFTTIGRTDSTSLHDYIGGDEIFVGSGSCNDTIVAPFDMEDDVDDRTTLTDTPTPGRKCRVTLVGSGPGDPDLLTVAAHRIITDPAAFLVVDRLVSPEILALIQGEYRVARKTPGCADRAQDEIHDWIEEAVRSHRYDDVVRLKIGDPFVFGRGGEEVLHFRNMFDRDEVDLRVIPGVSAAFAAPLLGGIPVTHRGVSNQVVLCTGYGRNGTSPDLLRYHPEQTVVFLMAVGRLSGLCESLVDLAGYPADTPVAIVENAGCPAQRTVVGDMTDIAALATELDVRPPSTIVVGEVVRVLLEGEEGELAHGLVDSARGMVMNSVVGN